MQNVKSRAIPVLTIPSEARSVASALSTAAPAAASQVPGALETAASQALQAIEASIPRNCSLGTKKFCVSFSNSTNCDNLPLNISKIIPAKVQKFLENEIDALQPLEGILAKLTIIKVQVSLILGLIVMFIIAFLFISLLFVRFLGFAPYILEVGVYTLCGLCFVFFFVPAFFFKDIQLEIKDLGSNIRVKRGNVGNLSIGALSCTCVITAIIIITLRIEKGIARAS